jgi:hypothetical protein
MCDENRKIYNKKMVEKLSKIIKNAKSRLKEPKIGPRG